MAEVSEMSGNEFSCLCSTGNTRNDTLQSFIGNDYFCESRPVILHTRSTMGW